VTDPASHYYSVRKMYAPSTDEIKEMVRNWFSGEGSKVESIKNDRAEFLFKVKFQRFFFTVVRPNDQNYIQIETQVMISPQHLKVLTGEKMQMFQMAAVKFAFENGVSLGFIKPRPGQKGPQPPGPGFLVRDRIYDDAVSNNQIWRVMQRLHTAVDMAIAILNEIAGQPGKKPQIPEEEGPSYYT
jgi:hypothetical protein